jgi:hypothetical protein
MARLSVESFLVVPFGDSTKLDVICNTMLVNALLTEGSKQTEVLESTLCLIVDILLDRIIEALSVKNNWTPAQASYGERELSLFTKDSKEYLIKCFCDIGLNKKEETEGSFALRSFCALYGKVSESVEKKVRLATLPHPITKQIPPPDLG